MPIKITDLKIGDQLGVEVSPAALAEIHKVARITKVQITLDNGQHWRVSKYGMWNMPGASIWSTTRLLSLEEANEHNAELQANKRKTRKVTLLRQGIAYEQMPETILDEFITVFERYRQTEAERLADSKE